MRMLPVLAAALALAPVAPAAASSRQESMMEDTQELLQGGPARRAAALDELAGLGVDIVKVRVQWRTLAPNGASEARPAFNASDPAGYPPGAFEALDDVVTGATQRGLKVFFMLSPPAPEWATKRGERAGHTGVLRADPSDFGRFVEAVGRRYSGTRGLPAVRMWSIWNEPNHPQFIQPLSERLGGRLAPSSPHQYRRLYAAAQGALARSGHARDTVLFGEILPVGQGRLSATSTLRPILFLREFFCLDQSYRPYRGAAARARGCTRFPKLRMSGLAYHAYTKPRGPRVPLPSPDDATIGQVRRIEGALDRIAVRTRRLRRGMPIYNSEFGLQTDPPDCAGFGTSLTNQAAFLNEAEWVSFSRPRVKTYSNYLLVDDAIRTQFEPGTNRRYQGFQTGLRYGPFAVRCESPDIALASGSAKQPGYDAFRTPIYVRRLRGAVQVFGLARPRKGQAQAIEVLRDGAVVKTVTTSGYFLTSVRGGTSGRWQLRWSFGGQTYTSRLARALADPSPRSL